MLYLLEGMGGVLKNKEAVVKRSREDMRVRDSLGIGNESDLCYFSAQKSTQIDLNSLEGFSRA